MLRDKIKDLEYFNEYIEYEDSRIQKFKNLLVQIGVNKKKTCVLYITSSLQNKMYAQYSRGDSKDEIRKTFEEYISFISLIEINSYEDYINVLSWMILFDYGINELKKIKKISTIEDPITKMFEQYIQSKTLKPINGSVLFEKEYKIFYEYLLDKCNKEVFLNYVNKEWYSCCKNTSWFDNHKSVENIYNGYWCWIAASVCKIKEIKIESVIQFLPSDLI